MTNKKWYFVKDIVYLYQIIIIITFFTMNLKEALTKFQEIVNNLEFARELQKSFLSLGQEVSLLKTPSKMSTLLLSFYFLFSKLPH